MAGTSLRHDQNIYPIFCFVPNKILLETRKTVLVQMNARFDEQRKKRLFIDTDDFRGGLMKRLMERERDWHECGCTGGII